MTTVDHQFVQFAFSIMLKIIFGAIVPLISITISPKTNLTLNILKKQIRKTNITTCPRNNFICVLKCIFHA